MRLSSGNLIASASDVALLLRFPGLLEFFSVEPYLIRGRKQFRFGVKLISDNGQHLNRIATAVEEYQVEVVAIAMLRG
jgi:hypothetical protein